MEYLQLACPYCAGQFSAAAAAESRSAVCPHCGRDVTVPAAAATASPPSLPTPSVPPPLPPLDRRAAAPPHPPAASPEIVSEPRKTIVNRRGETVSLRRLSPEEKARYHWRLNVAFAAIGMSILVIALIVLSRLRP